MDRTGFGTATKRTTPRRRSANVHDAPRQCASRAGATSVSRPHRTWNNSHPYATARHHLRPRGQSAHPAPPRAARGAREQPLVQLGPADARAVRAPPSAALGRGRPQPEGAAEADRREAARRRRRRFGLPQQLQPHPLRVRHLSQRAAAPRRVGVAPAERPRRLLLRRVRLPREPADLLRRPRHPRRRPLQGGERHAAAVRRRRAPLPAGLLLPDDRHRGRAAGGVCRLRLRRPAGGAGGDERRPGSARPRRAARPRR